MEQLQVALALKLSEFAQIRQRNDVLEKEVHDLSRKYDALSENVERLQAETRDLRQKHDDALETISVLKSKLQRAERDIKYMLMGMLENPESRIRFVPVRSGIQSGIRCGTGIRSGNWDLGL